MYIFILLFLVSSNAFGVQDTSEIEIKGYIHYPKVDEWSKDIVDDSFSIWNAVIGEGDLKHPAGDSLFVIKAKNASEKSRMTVEIINSVEGKKKVLKEGACSTTFDVSSKTLVCSLIIPQLHYGDVSIKVEYMNRGAGAVTKKTKINYGGSGC